MKRVIFVFIFVDPTDWFQLSCRVQRNSIPFRLDADFVVNSLFRKKIHQTIDQHKTRKGEHLEKEWLWHNSVETTRKGNRARLSVVSCYIDRCHQIQLVGGLRRYSPPVFPFLFGFTFDLYLSCCEIISHLFSV